ncbi:MAG: VOC family protein [Actinobacteria bacterium]|nr:MAG: VOC family protein [Actinomycetota bacterium]
MAHHSRVARIVIDVAAGDHDREIEFWRSATGAPLARYPRFPEYHGAGLPGADMGLLLQRLGDGASRIHLDIHTDDPAAEVARLERLGATRVREVSGWWIMRDPAGLLFCVVPEEPGNLNDANAQRWE